MFLVKIGENVVKIVCFLLCGRWSNIPVLAANCPGLNLKPPRLWGIP